MKEKKGDHLLRKKNQEKFCQVQKRFMFDTKGERGNLIPCAQTENVTLANSGNLQPSGLGGKQKLFGGRKRKNDNRPSKKKINSIPKKSFRYRKTKTLRRNEDSWG